MAEAAADTDVVMDAKELFRQRKRQRTAGIELEQMVSRDRSEKRQRLADRLAIPGVDQAQKFQEEKRAAAAAPDPEMVARKEAAELKRKELVEAGFFDSNVTLKDIPASVKTQDLSRADKELVLAPAEEVAPQSIATGKLGELLPADFFDDKKKGSKVRGMVKEDREALQATLEEFHQELLDDKEAEESSMLEDALRAAEVQESEENHHMQGTWKGLVEILAKREQEKDERAAQGGNAPEKMEEDEAEDESDIDDSELYDTGKDWRKK